MSASITENHNSDPTTRQHPIFDESMGVLSCGERFAVLTQSERTLFARLLRADGQVVSRECLYDSLYGNRSECDCPVFKIIEVLVCRIRRKTAQIGLSNLIDTVRARGFRVAGSTPLIALGLTRTEWLSLATVISLAGRQNPEAAERVRAAMQRVAA